MITSLGAVRHARGFTLLEALVAVVVISIGLLGLLGLQTVAVVNTQTSQSRTMASIAADDMADRIRANPAGAQDGEYDEIKSPYKKEDGAAPPVTDCVDANCSAAQIATIDSWEWTRTIFESLNGEGYVACSGRSSPGGPCQTFAIAVVWRERDEPNSELADSSAEDLCEDSALFDSLAPKPITDRCFITVFRL